MFKKKNQNGLYRRGKLSADTKRKAQAFKKKMKNTNPFDWWKWILLAFLGLIGWRVVKNIGENGLFSGAGSSEYSDNPDAGFFSYDGGTPGDTDGYLAGDSDEASSVDLDIQNLVDEIHIKLNGYNAFSYPEVVNRIANLTTTRVWKALKYWERKYKQGTGFTLYHFINNEFTGNNWIDGYLYEPALSKIESLGWKNK